MPPIQEPESTPPDVGQEPESSSPSPPKVSTLATPKADPIRLSSKVQDVWRRIKHYARHPHTFPPIESPLECVLYGLAQPWLGARVLFRSRELAHQAAIPVLAVLGFCAMVTLVNEEFTDSISALKAFTLTFAGLAALPPIIFGRHYARLAAGASAEMDLGPARPFLRSIPALVWEALSQLIIIAIGLAPAFALLKAVPVVGGILAGGLILVWTLHWVVVEALDSARTLRGTQTKEEAEALSGRLGHPWFVRIFLPETRRLPGIIRLPLKWYGALTHRLGKHWKQEIAVVEAFPWVALGFGAATAILLAIPVLNLAFRPVIIVAAVHILAQLEPLLGQDGKRLTGADLKDAIAAVQAGVEPDLMDAEITPPGSASKMGSEAD